MYFFYLRDWVMGGLGHTYLFILGSKEGGWRRKCVVAIPTPSPPAPQQPTLLSYFIIHSSLKIMSY